MLHSNHSPAQALKEQYLSVQKDTVCISSKEVAEIFGKKHQHVMRDIKGILKTGLVQQSNFGLSFKTSKLPNGGSKKNKYYNIDKFGFSLLAMGFTGEKALKFKIMLLQAFETMERELSTRMYGESMSLTELRKQVKPVEQKSFIYGHEKMYPLTQMRRAVGLYPNISGSERARYQNLIFKWKGRLYCTEQYVLMKLRLRTARKQRKIALQHCKEIAQRKLEYTAQVHSLNLGI